METGTKYQLGTPTLAIFTDSNQHRIAVTIPANAVVILRQIGGPMVDVEWDGNPVSMFAVDLERRGRIIGLAAV